MKTLFFLIFSMAMTFFTSFAAYVDYAKVDELKKWQKISTVVVSTEIMEHKGSKGTSYCPKINVKYDFHGSQTSILELENGPCRPVKSTLMSVIDKYKEGTTVVAFVNPNKHSEIRANTFSLGYKFYLLIFASCLFIAIFIVTIRNHGK